MELTDKRAKPAVFFGGKTRIIDFALSNALNSGIRRIGVATQYKAHSLIRHLQRGWNFLRPERTARAVCARTMGKVRLDEAGDRKSTRLNSSHANISYAVFCLKKKKKKVR